MSNDSTFEIEEDDIVKLVPGPNRASATGWVNVGLHAVHIYLTLDGHLKIETFPRTQEFRPTGAIYVSKDDAINQGGVDPDEDPDGDHKHSVDGIDYRVHVSHQGDVLEVYDSAGQKVASAEHDSMDEALHASFYDEHGRLEDHDTRQADLYEKPWREVATWLCSVHPNV